MVEQRNFKSGDGGSTPPGLSCSFCHAEGFTPCAYPGENRPGCIQRKQLEKWYEVNATPVTGQHNNWIERRWKGELNPEVVMSDDRLFLKVKIKSLADEARTIRKEELKLCGAPVNPQREELYLHRTRDVRGEQRAALLAYAFIRGKPYGAQERAPMNLDNWTMPDWKRVAQLVRKFGPKGMMDNGTTDADKVQALKDWSGRYWTQEQIAAVHAEAEKLQELINGAR